MAEKTWKDRLVEEVWELDLKMISLESHLVKKDPADPDYGIMRSQLVHMNDYMNDLLARCKCYNIEVKRPRFEKVTSKPKAKATPKSDELATFDMLTMFAMLALI